jgi:REP element-mobilizing transposase RayT
MSVHSVARLFVHFVWTTKYRLPTIAPDDDARLHRLLDDAAASVQCELIAVGNASEHVHVLVRVSAKVTVAAVAQRLKGRSSYFGGWRWQRGYFAECIHPQDVTDKARYIRNQRRHRPEPVEVELEVDAGGLLPRTSVSPPKQV